MFGRLDRVLGKQRVLSGLNHLFAPVRLRVLTERDVVRAKGAVTVLFER